MSFSHVLKDGNSGDDRWLRTLIVTETAHAINAVVTGDSFHLSLISFLFT